MADTVNQLLSYIAPGAPATRRPADGNEPFLRPEVGFTPKWYRSALGIDFGERLHTDVDHRREAVLAMRGELRRRFPGTRVGRIDQPDEPLDLLTGTYGASLVAAIYGVPIVYAEDNWPNCAHEYLTDDEIDGLEPPNLDDSPVFSALMDQVERIAQLEGRVEGFMNWQGVLNNAQRLRGEQIFLDMYDAPERCNHLFDCVATTMIDGARRLHERQRESGVEVGFFTVSNCLVNMVSAASYREFLLPRDQRISEAYGTIGIHNCAWTADPYIDDYAAVPNLAYIDMGHESDMERARLAFPNARRSIMYTPMDVANKGLDEIHADFTAIAESYGPCDMVLADIEAGTPDERVLAVIDLCREIGEKAEASA